MRISLSDPARAAEPFSPGARPDPLREGSPALADSPFARVLQGVGRELGRGEVATRAAIASMTAGSEVPPAQLLALQTGVYRYSESLDLASRLVDRVTSGVKTVLQGSGQ